MNAADQWNAFKWLDLANDKQPVGICPGNFFLRITTTSNKCENLNKWKLNLKVSEFRGRSHKTGVVERSISLSPNKTKGTAKKGLQGGLIPSI